MRIFKQALLSMMVLGTSLAIAQNKPMGFPFLPLVKLVPSEVFTKDKLLGPEVGCSEMRCPVSVTLYQVKGSDGKTLCSAAVPSSITLTGFQDSSKKPRTIIWNLDFTKITDNSYKYDFELRYGILLLSDSNDQMKNGGGAGDDDTNPNSTKFFHYKNRYLKKQNAAYLPIVLQTAPDGSVSMCAAVDPIIVNKD